MLKFFTIFLSSILLISYLYAGDKFSEMSTQELISIIGYVEKEKIEKFRKELESRVANMSEAEKKAYKENLEKAKETK